MPFYIGENKIVDRYIGDKLVIAAYKGETKYFDAYSEITGTLPIIFKSRAAVALKNYLLYGSSEGAGLETGNLFNKNDASMIYGPGYNLPANAKGAWRKYDGVAYTYRIPCEGSTTYTLITIDWINSIFRIATTSTDDIPTLRDQVDGNVVFYSTKQTKKTFTTPADAKYILFQGTQSGSQGEETVSSNLVVVKGSTAPTSYIPYGFKLPLMISSGAQSQDYPLYIGGSKLGEEEYLDYESGKVYKRTENLFNKDTITRGINLSATSVYKSNAAGCSDYIKVIPGEDYYFNRVRGIGAYYSCVEYDASKAPLRNRNLSGSTASGVITMNADAYYIRVNITLSLLSTIYVCRGTEPLENVPPYYIPTDPPVPLPPINAYQGENTLSSTETLGETTIKGRINELPTAP